MVRTGRAIVIGASMGGLLAARVLSETFERVTVIDRDTLPEGSATRRGVPQGRQVHGLLARGFSALDELFPGLPDDLVAQGALIGDSLRDFHWYYDGHLLAPGPSGLMGLAVSRPLLEYTVRQRVGALAGVEIVDRVDASGLATTVDRCRVTGVQVVSRGGGQPWTIPADLVVDATGRGSRAHVWLAKLGYVVPTEERVRVNVTYVTRHYERKPDDIGGRLGAVSAWYPGKPRLGFMLAQEGDRFGLVLAGILGEEPPLHPEGYLSYARSLDSPDIAEIVTNARPLDDPVLMRFPANVRRRYERLREFPDRYLPFGDALCSFNPTYGQGMTVAALEALLLRRLLVDGQHRLARRFFRGAAKIINIPWALAVGGDLRFPAVEGRRPPMNRLVNGYLARYHAAAAHDPLLGTAFLRVANLIDPLPFLFAPGLVRRVLRHRPEVDRHPALVRS
jgi:2-polyprenyl-6-methoxyphenol hydroxylase-like FAD-dependent oxidoreductase